MKTALVCGAGGFIGGHLVKKLKGEGYWVRGVDIKEHEFAPTQADEFQLLDLRTPENCRRALLLGDGTFDEVYQLAADMGGMGFIHSAECDIMHNSALINIHMTHIASEMGVPRYFFSSVLFCQQFRRWSKRQPAPDICKKYFRVNFMPLI